ncbi:phosphatase PAP2 family protein [Novosphingobium huizhouense]|uniref:phosphatase PAP2 family protein n=1 Tax=Novosphingobium huizhouense TaxID=2866625 RepID=UPI001CD8C447|nr:phosphatase PAP2 family protein [Novosphingobium huizhouense]
MPERPYSWRIAPAHALVASALCWAGFAFVAWAVATGRSGPIDDAGLLFWRRGAGLVPAGPVWLLEAVRDLTSLGGVLLRHLVVAGVLAALLFLRLRREAVLLVATVVGGWFVNTLVKLAVGRPRPLIVPHLTEAGGQSFPSGHSFNSAVVYIAIALAFAAMSPRRAVRWTLIGAAVVLSLAVAFTRVWLGVHFPSDVAAGWLGGAGWAFLASALLHRPAKAVAEQAGDTLDALTPAGGSDPARPSG